MLKKKKKILELISNIENSNRMMVKVYFVDLFHSKRQITKQKSKNKMDTQAVIFFLIQRSKLMCVYVRTDCRR